MTPRDQHRNAVYSAEDQVLRTMVRAADGTGTYDFHGSHLTIPVERRFGDVPSIQRYCDAVLALCQVHRTYPNTPPVRVRERKGQTKAHWQNNVIAIPISKTWAMRELVVLHELAHHIHRNMPTGRMTASHGPEFAAVYVYLVEEAVGPEIALLLRASFADARVPIAQLSMV